MIPYAPFIALLSNCFGLTADEDDAAKYARVRDEVVSVAPERAPDLAPFLATLLGIALPAEDAERVRYLEPPQLRERVFGAVREYLAALARRQPAVLVFEDLHWADPTSLDLLERLMALTGEAPLMLLAVFRPQRQEPSWRFHEAAARDHADRYTPIELAPLDDGQARELVANLLHIE